MKVLFVGPTSPDHLGSCLWDGLQEVLGEENVVDAVDSAWLHASSLARLVERQVQGEGPADDFPLIVQSISGSREGRRLRKDDQGSFDALVLLSSFNRDEGWGWARSWLSWLAPKGKVAYVEGWDAAWQVERPEISIDAAFRKEIQPGFAYPYQPHHLTFAAPMRWLRSDGELNLTAASARPCDVAFVGNPNTGHPAALDLRWRMLSQTFATKRRHNSVLATHRLGHDVYFRLLRNAKLALCPTAADSSDSLRTYEAAACGAIPVFIGYPPFTRDPWFGGEHCISCTVETLAEHLDDALSRDLTPMRERLREHVLASHTTRARALKVLKTLGFDA